jgi:hypothetical protein
MISCKSLSKIMSFKFNLLFSTIDRTKSCIFGFSALHLPYPQPSLPMQQIITKIVTLRNLQKENRQKILKSRDILLKAKSIWTLIYENPIVFENFSETCWFLDACVWHHFRSEKSCNCKAFTYWFWYVCTVYIKFWILKHLG